MTELIYRVDTYVVPEAARDEFWGTVRDTHAVLREQAGFVDDAMLEKQSGTGRFDAVTIVRWSPGADLAGIRAAVQAAHRATGFDAHAFFARTGISADTATYIDH